MSYRPLTEEEQKRWQQIGMKPYKSLTEDEKKERERLSQRVAEQNMENVEPSEKPKRSWKPSGKRKRTPIISRLRTPNRCD